MPGHVRYNEGSRFLERSQDGGVTFVTMALMNPRNRFVATATTLTIPDGSFLSLIDYINILGTGAVVIQGDGILEVRK